MYADHAAGLAGAVCCLADLVFEAAISGLIRHIDAGTRRVKLPAVIHATQPALLAAAKEQRGAPCRQIPRK